MLCVACKVLWAVEQDVGHLPSHAGRRVTSKPCASLAAPCPRARVLKPREVVRVIDDEAIGLAVLSPLHRSDASSHVTAPPTGQSAIRASR